MKETVHHPKTCVRQLVLKEMIYGVGLVSLGQTAALVSFRTDRIVLQGMIRNHRACSKGHKSECSMRISNHAAVERPVFSRYVISTYSNEPRRTWKINISSIFASLCGILGLQKFSCSLLRTHIDQRDPSVQPEVCQTSFFSFCFAC